MQYVQIETVNLHGDWMTKQELTRKYTQSWIPRDLLLVEELSGKQEEPAKSKQELTIQGNRSK